MKLKFTLLFVFLFAVILQAQENPTSTYYLIRHAEKEISENPNPNLNTTGIERAKRWSEIFEHIHFDAIYSTDYIRTQNTVIPTAEKQNIEVILYHPMEINYSIFRKNTHGKTVLIVGHSNTIPKFVNTLIGEIKYSPLDENIYGNLYIIEITRNTKTDKLLNLQ